MIFVAAGADLCQQVRAAIPREYLVGIGFAHDGIGALVAVADSIMRRRPYRAYVFDCRLRFHSGFEVARWLEKNGVREPVIYVSVSDDLAERVEAAQLSAAAYIPAGELERSLPSALRGVLNGERD